MTKPIAQGLKIEKQSNGWQVIHAASGLKVGLGWRLKGQATAAARRIGEVTDWTADNGTVVAAIRATTTQTKFTALYEGDREGLVTPVYFGPKLIRIAQRRGRVVHWQNFLAGMLGQSGYFRLPTEEEAAAFAKYASEDGAPALDAETLEARGFAMAERVTGYDD